MARYHLNPETGNPGICRADPSNPHSTGCRFKQDESEHYGSKEEAARGFERTMEIKEDPDGFTAELEGKLVRGEAIDFDTIKRGLGWIREWEKPWTEAEAENMRKIERLQEILDRDPFTDGDEAQARRILDGFHPAVTPQQTRGYSSSSPYADNWRARDKMIHDLGADLLSRKLADGLSYEPVVGEEENSRIFGLRRAQEAALESYNHPQYTHIVQENPEIGEVEEHFQEAISRIRRGDEAASAEIIRGSDQRSLLSPQQRLFNMLHEDSPLYNQQLYLATVFPVHELKSEMNRVGIDGVSVTPFENGREWGNVYTVMTPDGNTKSFSVYEHRNTDSIIINGRDNWDGEELPYSSESKQDFFAEFSPDDRDRAAQALTFYLMESQRGTLESSEELRAKLQRRDWNAILDSQIPGFKAWRQERITDSYIAPEQENEEDILKRLDF